MLDAMASVIRLLLVWAVKFCMLLSAGSTPLLGSEGRPLDLVI